MTRKPPDFSSRAAVVLGCSIILASGLAGCGSAGGAPGTYELSGAIEYKGEPIPGGTIMLIPDNTQGNQGTAGLAEIKDGQYKTVSGRGVQGGPYILRLNAHDDNPVPVPGADPSEGPRARPTPLFPADSEMKVTLPPGEKTFDIEVVLSPSAARQTDPRND
jgi:hypothetical protein